MGVTTTQTLLDKGSSLLFMEGGWLEGEDRATERVLPSQHPPPEGTPNQKPSLTGQPDHLLLQVIPRPRPVPQLSLDLGDRCF